MKFARVFFLIFGGGLYKCGIAFNKETINKTFEASYIYLQAAPAAAVVHQVAVGVARVVAVVLPPPLHPGTRARGTWHGTRVRLVTLHVAGIKFHVSSQLRRHDAGIMELGLIYNNLMAVRAAELTSAN